MLIVAQDYNMFSLQLRIISLMVEHNDISHSRNELLQITNNAWAGLVAKSLTFKIVCPDIDEPDRF